MKYVIQRKIMKNMDQVYVATTPYLEPCPNWNRNGNFVHFFQEGWARPWGEFSLDAFQCSSLLFLRFI